MRKFSNQRVLKLFLDDIFQNAYQTNNLHPRDMVSFNKSVQCRKQQVLIKLSYLGYEGCVTCVQDKIL